MEGTGQVVGDISPVIVDSLRVPAVAFGTAWKNSTGAADRGSLWTKFVSVQDSITKNTNNYYSLRDSVINEMDSITKHSGWYYSLRDSVANNMDSIVNHTVRYYAVLDSLFAHRTLIDNHTDSITKQMGWYYSLRDSVINNMADIVSLGDSITNHSTNYYSLRDSVRAMTAGTLGDFANKALSNLAGVAINTDLLPSSSNAIGLGSATKMWSDAFIGSGGVINFDNGDVTLTHAANTLTLGGGTLALGSNNLTMTGSLGATAARVTKGWFADLEMTNLPSVNGVALTTTVTKLNYLTSITGVIGTVTGKVVLDTSPTLLGTITASGADSLLVPIRAYNATTFNNSKRTVSEDSFRDKIETITAGGLLPVGTEGKTLYSNAGVWTATSNWFYDDVNSYWGINSATPERTLAIHGVGSGDSKIGLYVNKTGTDQIIFGVSNTGSGENDALMRLYDNGTATVLIAANNSRGGDSYFNAGGNLANGTNDDLGYKFYNNGTLYNNGAATINGTLALGANSLTMTGSIGSTGSRVTKGWFVNIEVTDSVLVADRAYNATTWNGSNRVPTSNAIRDQIIGLVPTTRVLTINGMDYDLSANRTYNVGNADSTHTLSQFAATTSAQFAGVISDEVGLGKVVLDSATTFKGLTTIQSTREGQKLTEVDGKIVVCDGDSRTVGYTGGTAYPYSDHLALDATYHIYNTANGGATLTYWSGVDWKADLAYQNVDKYLANTGVSNIVVIWAGVNDMYVNDVSATLAYRGIKAYCEQRRQKGWKVIVCTEINCTDASIGDTRRLDFNTLVRNNWTSFADYLCDLGNTSPFNTATSHENLTYYLADGVHLTAAGYQVIATTVSSAITAFASYSTAQYKSITLQIYDPATKPVTASNVAQFSVPCGLDGWKLSKVEAHSYTSTGGDIIIQVKQSVSEESTVFNRILSDSLYVKHNYYDSKSYYDPTAGPYVINTTYSTVSEGHVLAVDVYYATNTTRLGLDLRLDFTR
jgi:lysophospholipase L1-like esterase